ncbi:MAG: hypothetical protein AABO58_04930 [Acidobacteriota bacterium]
MHRRKDLKPYEGLLHNLLSTPRDDLQLDAEEFHAGSSSAKPPSS